MAVAGGEPPQPARFISGIGMKTLTAAPGNRLGMELAGRFDLRFISGIGMKTLTAARGNRLRIKLAG